MKEYKPFKSGKVRELYDLGDSLVMVCTDRISAFDNILKCPIPEKGCVLNRMSKFWFDLTKDIVPNHMISIDTKDMPEFFQTAEFEGRSMKTQKLDMIPVECIVRGYITGSGWEGYQKDGKVCGIQLPEGLKECRSSRSRSSPHPPKHRRVNMTRTFPWKKAKNGSTVSSRAKARNTWKSCLN